MDKSWMTIRNRLTDTRYKEGVKSFINFAEAHLGSIDVIRCPCIDCENGKKLSKKIVAFHLIQRGISPTYKIWRYHGETITLPQPHVSHEGDCDDNGGNCSHSNRGELDDFPTMLEDVTRGLFMDDDTEDMDAERMDAHQFDTLLNNAERPLWKGCKYSVLSFVIRMLHLKMYNKWSNSAFDMTMKVFKETLPECDENVPWTLYQAKKFLRDLGLGYVGIHACKYDCMLFWKENAKLEKCPTCQEPRYKFNDGVGKKIPHKVLRYLQLTPRLKRLYTTEDMAVDMRWHKDKLVTDGTLRHPADGMEWKNFDARFPDFSSEPRNVRLGIATDGFNPFGNMSTSYSMWPVVVTPYNLPPWKCMKEQFFMMPLLIPGRSAPGREIDVYLRPLIDELKELWEDGVLTYDASTETTFRMCAAVLWTINDFPAYGNLSGWSTKGYKACPICNDDASSQKLQSKIGYMGARRWLPENHVWRRSKLFDGKYENRSRPLEMSGDQTLAQIESGTYKPFGKNPHPCGEKLGMKRKRGENPSSNWKKKSIFFQLPYWRTLQLRHNLDVMHIEKNICDNLIGTLLGIDGKNKDTEKARLDLEKLKIRKELHLKPRPDGKFDKPDALYTLPMEHRRGFCEFINSIKYPDGYAANLSACVNTQGGKLSGLKSHDCRVLLQRILPLGMRGYLQKELATPLLELGNFFQQLCAKTLKLEDLDKLENQIVQVLCKLEKIFPPAFFDVMVHLEIHLPREAKLGGPVQYRWMYPIERLLGMLKGFVGNKARPEGSIVEAYIAKECTTFCSMYLHGMKTVFNREDRNDDGTGEQCGKLGVFAQRVRAFGLNMKAPDVPTNERDMAHWFVLQNSDEIDHYLETHMNLLRNGGASGDLRKRQCKEFPKWFKAHINELRSQMSPEATNELWALANGPIGIVNTYSRCISKGARFHTIDRDNRRKSQNSGVAVFGDDDNATNYYGRLCKVWEMTYLCGNRVILFQCEWYNSGHRTLRVEPHCTSIDIRSRSYKDDPFVLPIQVKQVFYVNDTLLGANWKIIERYQQRGIWSNIQERDDLEPNEAADEHLTDDPFQQDVTNEAGKITDDNPIPTMSRGGAEVITDPVAIESIRRELQGGIVDDDGFTSDDEDEVREEHSDEAEDEMDYDTDIDGEM